MRTTLPVIIAFLAGFVMVMAFFFNPEESLVGQFEQEVLKWVTIIGGFTLLLGVASIVRVNYTAVRRRRENWGFKLATLVSIFVMAIPAVLPTGWSHF